MVVKYIVSRFTRQAPNPTTVAKAAAKRAANSAGLNPTTGLGASVSASRLTGTAPPVNMARPTGSGSFTSGGGGTSRSAVQPSSAANPGATVLGGSTQPTRQHITAAAATMAAPAESASVGIGKGPKVVVDFNKPPHKTWMPDATTIQSHPSIPAIKAGLATGGVVGTTAALLAGTGAL